MTGFAPALLWLQAAPAGGGSPGFLQSPIPMLIAIMETGACRLSVVATTTASISFWFSSIRRKSR